MINSIPSQGEIEFT